MLLLPPALNLKGIDEATLTAMRQKCCASAPSAGQNRGSTSQFWWPAKLIVVIDWRYLSGSTSDLSKSSN